MTVTNEPGVYKSGKYGVRTENTMLIVDDQTTDFGKFYKFEALTLCPIDLKPVLPELLSSEEKVWLNDYHQKVYATLSPYLSKEEKNWLKESTKAIH
jgi:Xaa-Pro aminopeptidase